MSYQFQKATIQDYDELYAHPDADNWLKKYLKIQYRRHFGNFVKKDNDYLFWLSEDTREENGEWYIYFDKTKGMLISQHRGGFVILYISPKLKPIKTEVINTMLDIFIECGEYLDGKVDDFDFITQENCHEWTFVDAKPNDFGRY